MHNFYTDGDLTGRTLLACGAPDDDDESVRGGHFEGFRYGTGVAWAFTVRDTVSIASLTTGQLRPLFWRQPIDTDGDVQRRVARR